MYLSNFINKIELIFLDINIIIDQLKEKLNLYFDLEKCQRTFYLDTFCYTEIPFTHFKISNYMSDEHKKEKFLNIILRIRRDLNKMNYIYFSLDKIINKKHDDFQNSLNVSVSQNDFITLQIDTIQLLSKLKSNIEEFKKDLPVK
jgi:hypothetical protein